jgi:hypothetical protein
MEFKEEGRGMDPQRFEDLTRRVSRASDRRAAVKAVVAAVAAPVLLGLGRQEAVAGIPIVNCKVPGKRCDTDQKCCSGNCRKGICSCVKKGQACWDPLEGALCCSGRCSSGKCA